MDRQEGHQGHLATSYLALSPHYLYFWHKMKGKGRAVGVPNYQNDLFINCVEAILPDGALQWTMVAQRYHQVSGEKELRENHDLKRYFTTHKNLCDNGKKVTGSSAPKPQVARCQMIFRAYVLSVECSRNF